MNNIKSAFRAILKFKVYSSINLIGLVIGLACSILLFLYVDFQYSFDEFYPDKDRIFRISEISTSPNKKDISPTVRIPVGPDIKEAFPEVEQMTRFRRGAEGKQLQLADKKVSVDRILYVENNFFNFFSFGIKQGNPDELISDEQSIVLSEKTAEKLFGKENPVGKTVTMDNKTYFVTGVAENIPLNSHIQFDLVLPLKPLINRPDIYIGWDGGHTVMTFIKLLKSSQKTIVESKFPALLWEKLNKKQQGSGFFSEFFLEPINMIHLHSDVDYDYNIFNRKQAKNIWLLFFIGCIIFVAAFINYLFISGGTLSLRFKEFKVKNFLGIGKYGNIKLIFTESFILFFLSGLLAILVIVLLKPFVIEIFGNDFITYSLKSNLVEIILFILSISCISSLILYLFNQGRFREIRFKTMNSPSFRNQKINYISALQFCIAIVLISSVIVVYKQYKFALNKDLGFQSENIINISHDMVALKSQELVTEIKKLTGVKNASASLGLPGLESTRNGYRPEGINESLMLTALYVDDNFLKTFDIKLVKGRAFYEGTENDKQSYLINETLAKQLNWDDPLGRTIFRDGAHQVVGVVKDFHVASIYEKIPPMVISKEMREYFFSLSVALNPGDPGKTLKQIEGIWKDIFPGEPFHYFFLDQKFGDLYAEITYTSKILLIFSCISVLICALGLFGITILMLNSRVKEIGIRKVNGAKVSEVLAILNKNVAIWISIAFVIGCPLAWAIMKKWLESFAYKIDLSWCIFALAGSLTILVALLTVSVQTWRAARRNPVEALRYE